MGITAVLETEDGKPLATVEDPTNVLVRVLPEAGDPKYQCLSCIDRYGDTTFNYLQASGLLREWNALKVDVGDSEAGNVVGAVRRLIERVQGERHIYLKFYGD